MASKRENKTYGMGEGLGSGQGEEASQETERREADLYAAQARTTGEAKEDHAPRDAHQAHEETREA